MRAISGQRALASYQLDRVFAVKREDCNLGHRVPLLVRSALTRPGPLTDKNPRTKPKPIIL